MEGVTDAEDRGRGLRPAAIAAQTAGRQLLKTAAQRRQTRRQMRPAPTRRIGTESCARRDRSVSISDRLDARGRTLRQRLHDGCAPLLHDDALNVRGWCRRACAGWQKDLRTPAPKLPGRAQPTCARQKFSRRPAAKSHLPSVCWGPSCAASAN